MSQPQQLKGNLDVLLLSILSDGPAHGYAIIGALKERSNGDFDLPEGTIYPALHRLENTGLLNSSWSQADGRRRCVYRISTAGRAELRAKTAEWKVFATSMQTVLGWSA